MSKLRKSLRLARARVLKHPRSAKYREQYLRAKGRLGIYDSRMNYYHVPMEGVNPAVKRFLARGYAYGLVATATVNGQHSATSLHPSGNAGDLGVVGSLVGTREARHRLESFQRAEFKQSQERRLELIGPVNDHVILRGRKTSLPEGSPLENQHDNHVHGGYRR